MSLRLVMAVLCAAGLGVAGYLTVVYAGDVSPFCVAGEGCSTVQASKYASFAGIDVPVLGLIGYALIAGSLLVPGDAGRLAGAGLALVGFGFSAYLTYLELGVIEAICFWCVVSAVLMTLLAVLAVARVLRASP